MAFTEIKMKYGGNFLVRFYSESESPLHRWNEKRHMHAEYEFHVILEGRCRLTCDEGTLCLKTGEAAVIVPGAYHSTEQDSEEHTRLPLSVAPLDRRAKEQMKQAVTASAAKLVLTRMAAETAKAFLEESFDPDRGNDPVLQALLLVLATELFRVLQMEDHTATEQKEENRKIRSGIIDNFFQNQITETRGRDVLAGQLGISVRQVDRVLEEKYGMTYRDKLLETRMDRAGNLLKNSGKSISEISFEVGYTSENAFFKQFRRYYRTTPGAYRRESIKNIN